MGRWTEGTQKRFAPLENNPAVFAPLARELGASSKIRFHDVLSLDPSYLSSSIPHPPVKESMEIYDGYGADEPVVWFRQTMGNVCGLMALIHALSNGRARKEIAKGSLLDRLLEEAIPLKPEARTKVLYDSEELHRVYEIAAATGDSNGLPKEIEAYHHFTAFVKVEDGTLWELNGALDGPLVRGQLGAEEDVLSERAMDWTARKFLSNEQEMTFSIVAVTIDD
ncbi:cysteine proteinase [Atractiella rhizophila]|nr:cysteine proteinase [Atractiella rhizophila]